ncbi:MAG: hypothetical protein ACYDG2_13220 [Ruminiclostridium sp.]
MREIEKELFNKYRIALNRAVEEQTKTTRQTDWLQIYDDILYPAFNELDMKLVQVRSGAFKRTFAAMGILSTVILAGRYSNLVSQNISDTLIHIGTSMASAGGNYLLDRNNKMDMKNNDFYFLWRLKKDLDKKKK